MPAVNLIIHPAPPLPLEAQLQPFQDVVTPHLSDNLDRLCGIVRLRRFHAGRKLVGSAVTVKTRPGDNLAIYKALMDMQPGQVLVVDGDGDLNNALVGDLLLQYALQRGCAGFIIDGAIRDSAAFRDHDFPCYARGVSHRGPYKHGPGAINVPVSVGGQVVHPGDVVVGDEDGVVTFPVARASGLLEAAQRSAAREAAIQQEIATGRIEQSWLKALGL